MLAIERSRQNQIGGVKGRLPGWYIPDKLEAKDPTTWIYAVVNNLQSDVMAVQFSHCQQNYGNEVTRRSTETRGPV